ncbi:MAG TPA: hypothetical protein GXX28_00200, partial [Firmicutes bacterium]|nr:hypothetical protein [Bacillota bacterium]
DRLQALKESRLLAAVEAGATAENPVAALERPVAAAERPGRGVLDIAAVVPPGEGEELETPYGPCFHRMVRYPLAHRRGCHTLAEALALPPEIGGRLARPRLPEVDWRQAAFLDTETTGLAGGTGTFAFLVGVGHFVGGEFALHQFFLRDYAGEPALLWALGQLLVEFPVLVTFNGRRFDWPLLEARFTVARLRAVLPRPVHLDLLYPAWALWKRRLGSCRLCRLEEAVLGAEREADVPGWLIPQLYFTYLRSGDAGPLAPVLHHNLLDILSLVSLTAAVGDRLTAPRKPGTAGDDGGPQTVPGEDLLAVGRFYEREGEAETALQYYLAVGLGEGAAAAGAGRSVRREALAYLGALAKREGRWALAEEAWGRLAEEFHSAEALIELAKLYEHRYDDPERAREATDRAAELVRLRRQLLCRPEAGLLSELARRRERLSRKLAKRG